MMLGAGQILTPVKDTITLGDDHTQLPCWAVAGPLPHLGAASYSIYLFQFIFIGLIWHAWLAAGLDRVMPHTASFPLLAVGGVVGGILASQWIEHPLIRLARSVRLRQPLTIGG
jgi:peptidoglycan/LPS O-acetylase OafA/YrhL